MIKTRDFKLDRWTREARELATCVACYGVGETPTDGLTLWGRGRTCEACAGRGKAAREPHVLELVAMVRASDAEAVELARDRYAEAMRARKAEEALAAAERLSAETVERLLRSEEEGDELRREIDRLRGELYQERARRLQETEE